MQSRNIIIFCFLNLIIFNRPWSFGFQIQEDKSTKIKAAIENYVQQKLRLARDEIIIEYPNFNTKFVHFQTSGKIKVLPEGDNVLKGNRILTCGLFQNGQLQETFNIRVKIRTYQSVVVTNKRLPRHAILEKENLTIHRQETTNISQKFYTSIEDLLGLRTKRVIQAGDIITENLVEPPPLITRGKPVKIHFFKGMLEIILLGVARQDGRLGELIKVKCLETNKNFKAKIIDPNTVMVNFL